MAFYYKFPKSFLWGCAASSYQIEGAAKEDGRGSSIWDDFCAKPGAVLNGESGAVACDHYHLWESDLDMMKALGFQAYRFSVAWPRIVPDASRKVNQKGLDFYDRLVDGMLKRGLDAFCTLYHWDLPSWCQAKGGWAHRETAYWFGEYAEALVKRLGDRVKAYTTHNEMPCIVDLGHRFGIHAPGYKDPEKTIRQVNHHVLLAHGLGMQAIRANAKKAQAGIVHNPGSVQPFTESDEDMALAAKIWHDDNGWMLDPLYIGKYPENQWKALGKDVPKVKDGDMKTICQPMDYIGLNIYGHRGVARASASPEKLATPEEFPKTGITWDITEDSLYHNVRFTADRYKPAEIYITENGCSYHDQMTPEGTINDFHRVSYLRNHLKGLHRAIQEKLPIKGYFAWSIMDNFEWAYGYKERFGIVHVNFETQKRTPKASAQWLSAAIANRGF